MNSRIPDTRVFARHVPAEKSAPLTNTTANTAVSDAEARACIGAPMQPLPTGASPLVANAALLAKFGLEQGPVSTTNAGVMRRFAGNIRAFASQLRERTVALVKQTVSVLGAVGLAARKCTTLRDLAQLHDFAKLAIGNGQPLALFGPLADVAGFVLKYPDEARKVLRFMDQVEGDAWKQKSAWMSAATSSLKSVDGAERPPRKQADIVIIGAGLSAGHTMRNLADAFASGDAKPRQITVLEKDSLAKREHAASLRNAGIVCTSMDYVFDIDEAIGPQAAQRIQDALHVSPAEADAVYRSMMQVMHNATHIIETFLRSRGVDVDVELRHGGGLDVVMDEETLTSYRSAVRLAREYGMDWEVVDKAFLKDHYGVDGDDVKGALKLNDSAQLHPGKLVKALFDYSKEKMKDVRVDYETEVLGARPDETGDGWILDTNKGEIHAKDVIDAREAFAPYRFREARFSQIHIVDVADGSGPAHLGDTNVTHGLTYMRKVSEGKFLCGSGDFPLRSASEPPRPLASVALYAASHFKQMFPDTPYNIEHMWGGVFGLNKDNIPTAGSLLKGWHVLGGAGGSGHNFTPAIGKAVADELLGRLGQSPLQPAEQFSPR
ncbi:MAG TPA: FAD-binding oxidoreductase, partial [Myxococcota bacterium]